MGKNALGWCLLFMLLGFQPLRVSTPWRQEQLGPIGYTSSLAESSKYGDTQAPPFTGASGTSVAISQTPSLPVWKGRSGRRPGLLLPLSCLFSVSHYQMTPGCCTNSCAAVGDVCGLHRPCLPVWGLVHGAGALGASATSR